LARNCIVPSAGHSIINATPHKPVLADVLAPLLTLNSF
jgi:hypothetical protein